MKKKILKLFLSSSIGIGVMGLIILIPCLMLMDFFGANVTDGYVENNSEYSDMYKEVLNKNIKTGNGYVSLERILYFYLATEDLTFDEIYNDNLDTELKKQKTISEVCELSKYNKLSVCSEEEIASSGQINEEQSKPFNAPLKISNMNVTSFFMQERVVYGNADVHHAWDLSSSNNTPVYSVCDGTVTYVSFKYETNTIDTNGGGGNQIKIKCQVDDDTIYEVWYAHLYPKSAKVKVGDTVTHYQQIAEVGTTGYSTGPHLHYQVSLNGSYIDGMSLIDFTYDESEVKDNYLDNKLDNKLY
jgi:murein DD-endopeptidase MepM/ murein hydrolase activator NlpD